VKFLRSFFGKKAAEPVMPSAPVDAAPDPVLAALAELEVKRLREALAATAAAAAPQKEPQAEVDLPPARPSRVVKTKAPLPDRTAAPAISIWDVEANEEAKASVEPERRRPTRSKTRILGFDLQPASVVPLFDDTEKPAIPQAPAEPGQGYVMFPAGWLIVKAGAGRGTAFALTQGVSQIGRGSDQTVALDFGDMAISRQNHAAIAYDAGTHQFHIGHGGKSNLVRLNGKPLLSTEVVRDGDEIQIGETTLLLKVLCTPSFNWSASDAGGDGHDVAIA
jgi:hypothetical protein